MAAGEGGKAGERAVEQLAVGVEQDGDVVAGLGDARVAGRAEPGVVRQLDHLGTALAGQAGAAVGRAAVDDHELRRVDEVPLDRVEQHAQLGLGVVEDDDGGEGHAPATSSSAAPSACPAASHDRSASAAAPPAARRARSASSRATSIERGAQRLDVAGRHVERAGSRRSRAATAGRTRRPGCRGRSPRAAGSRSPRTTTAARRRARRRRARPSRSRSTRPSRCTPGPRSESASRPSPTTASAWPAGSAATSRSSALRGSSAPTKRK